MFLPPGDASNAVGYAAVAYVCESGQAPPPTRTVYVRHNVVFVVAALIVVVGVGALVGFSCGKACSGTAKQREGRAAAVHVATATAVASTTAVATAVSVAPSWPTPHPMRVQRQASCPARTRWHEAGIVDA